MLVALRPVYLLFVRLLRWLALLAWSDAAKQAEILVLRHQLAMLRRAVARPRPSWADPAVIAARTRLLPRSRRTGLFITPGTVLRWRPLPDPVDADIKIIRKDRLSELVHEYAQVA